MKFTKKYFLLLISLFLIVTNIYSQTEQLDVDYIKTSKKKISNIHSKIFDEFINNKWHHKGFSSTIKSSNAEDATVVDYVISTLIDSTKYRYSYSYYEDLHLATNFIELWDGTQWINSEKITYTYDENGNMTSYLQEDWEEDKWFPFSRGTNIYNSEGYKVLELFEMWQEEWGKNERVTYSYTFGNAFVATILNEYWDGNQWRNVQKKTIVNDDSGVIVETWENWNESQWVNNYEITYSLDSNWHLILEFCVKWDGNDWQNFSQKTIDNNSDGNKTLELYQLWNNGWEDHSRKKYIYNSSGNLISGTSEIRVANNWVANDAEHTFYVYSTNDGGGNIFYNEYPVYGFAIEVFYKTITGVESTDELISNYSLSQNYPNPFNPTTTISYTVASVKSLYATSPKVQLRVYNLLGKEVATLVNRRQSAGNYEVSFDAANLPSGVYFYQLKIENYSSAKKMLLLE